FTIANDKAAFNVNAFPEREEVSLSVEEGETCVSKIKSTDKGAPDKIPMMELRHAREVTSSEAIAFNKKNDSFNPVENKNTTAAFGWRKGVLYFDKSKPKEILNKLERWYGIDIKYNACAFKGSENFSGEFHRAGLKKVLQYLSK